MPRVLERLESSFRAHSPRRKRRQRFLVLRTQLPSVTALLDERKRERTSTSPAIRSSSNTANLHLAISNSFSALSASISAVLIRAFHAPKSGPVAPEGPENDFCFSIPILGLFRASLIFPDDCRPP